MRLSAAALKFVKAWPGDGDAFNASLRFVIAWPGEVDLCKAPTFGFPSPYWIGDKPRVQRVHTVT